MINVNTITIEQFKAQFPEGVGGYTYLPVWSDTTSYNINDIVYYNGQFYQAIAENTNETPPNPLFWVSYSANVYSYISDAEIQNAFLLAAGCNGVGGLFPSNIFCYDCNPTIIYAYCLLVAHILLYFIKPQEFTYQGQTPAGIGAINSQTVGNVSLSRSIPDVITNSVLASTLNTTIYGQQYLILVDLRSKWRMIYSFGGIPD